MDEQNDDLNDYEAEELEKIWLVINAALRNRSSGDSIELRSSGHEPFCSVTVKAYVFKKFIRPK